MKLKYKRAYIKSLINFSGFADRFFSMILLFITVVFFSLFMLYIVHQKQAEIFNRISITQCFNGDTDFCYCMFDKKEVSCVKK